VLENELDTNKYFLQPGYIFVSKEPHLISTVLGSCVSVCIWDCKLNFGGINHYIHPKPFRTERNSQFGSIAVPYLIKLLLNMGAQKNNLKAHITGGAQSPDMNSYKIGRDNIRIAEKVLKHHSIEIITRDTGGEMGRKVVFNNETGEIVIYKVNNLRNYDWYKDD